MPPSPRRSPRPSLALALLLALACGESDPPAAAAPAPAPDPFVEPEPDPRPNLLLIVLDTTRRDRLSTYGYARPTAPALDAIAAEGTVFENAVSAAPWTVPAHASLFTGLYPHDHGATIESHRLRDENLTLAELLSDAGYFAAGFCSNPWIEANNGFTQGFEHYEDIWRELDGDVRDQQGAARATERALAWIHRNDPYPEPWFVFVNLLEPHSPYSPPPPHRYRFVPDDLPLETVQRVTDWNSPRDFGYMLGLPGYEIDADEFRAMNALYDGEISYQDTRLGALLEDLRIHGILDDTVVAIVADHGEQLGEHGMLGHKMTLFEENVRVPLLLRHPATVPAGRRIASPVQAHDLFHTLLAYAEVDHPLPPDGARLPLDPESPVREHTVVEFGRPTMVLEDVGRDFPGVDLSRWDRSLRAVRGERFKLIAGSDGERLLFDIAADPGEQRNLAGSRPETVRELETLLERLTASSRSAAAQPPPDMDPEQVEALRALGYAPEPSQGRSGDATP